MGNPFDNPKSGAATKTAAKPEPKAKGGLATANGDDEPTAAAPPRAGDPFALPSGGGGDYNFTDFLNELLLVRPTEYVAEFTTKRGVTDVVRVDVIRLDNDNEFVEDVLVFQMALKRNLKKVLRGPNEWVLGRLALGEAKNGNNAPYILDKPTEDEIAHASEVMKQLGLL